MKKALASLFALFLLACTGSTPAQNNPVAPEFRPGLPWLNVSRPLTMQDLRGKVVLLDFWTYGCINCLHVIPDLKKLEAKYGDKLAVVSVHSPKFDNERNLDTLRSVVIRYDMTHPVVNDVEFDLWRQYGLRAWPTLILVDPAGGVVGGVSGEGHYQVLDMYVGQLMEGFKDRLDPRPLPLALEKERLKGTFLAAPGKIAVSDKYVAVSDTLHHRVVVLDPDGRVAAIYGDGKPGLMDGSGRSARFQAPQGLSFAGDSLYVADTGNHAIRHIDLVRQKVRTIAGTGEVGREVYGELEGRHVPLASPWDVLHHEGHLYIAVTGAHQLWRMALSSGLISHFSGSGREDMIDGDARNAAFSQPSGLSLHGAWLYVADAEDSALRRVDLASGRVETLAGSGLFEWGDRDGLFKSARLQHLLGVAVLDEGRVLVADTYNHKLKLADLKAGTLATLAGTGKPGKGEGAALASALSEPGGVAVGQGKIWIADTNNHRIMQYDQESRMLREWVISPP